MAQQLSSAAKSSANNATFGQQQDSGQGHSYIANNQSFPKSTSNQANNFSHPS
jgi:hypothetical protein